tara:strand:+ start:4207 stop:4731 length:525 start_codon:yes stop_codon:yes gene_type:complete
MLRLVTIAVSTSIATAHVTNIRSVQFGTDSIATADNAVAMGVGTRADDFASLVIGHYNKINNEGNDLHGFQHTGQAFVVGNGHAESDRSNALELDFDGNLDIAGDLTLHGCRGQHDACDKPDISLRDIYDRLTTIEQLLNGCRCSSSIFNCDDAEALKVQFNTVISEKSSCDAL